MVIQTSPHPPTTHRPSGGWGLEETERVLKCPLTRSINTPYGRYAFACRAQTSPCWLRTICLESARPMGERRWLKVGLRWVIDLTRSRTLRAENPSRKSLTCCWFHLRSGMRTKPSAGSGFSKTIRSASAFLSRMLYTHWWQRERGFLSRHHPRLG